MEHEGYFTIEYSVNNNAAESMNNVGKAVVRSKRGVHRDYLQGVLDLVSFRYWDKTTPEQDRFEDFLRNFIFNNDASGHYYNRSNLPEKYWGDLKIKTLCKKEMTPWGKKKRKRIMAQPGFYKDCFERTHQSMIFKSKLVMIVIIREFREHLILIFKKNKRLQDNERKRSG